MSIQRLLSDTRMSAIVKHGQTVYLAGEVANDLEGDIEAQTGETLANIESLLAQAGTDKGRILSATIYLRDIETDFAGMNRVWGRWLAQGTAPARATVQAALCDRRMRVEISVVAATAG